MVYSQGTINVFNFSNYDAVGRLAVKGKQTCFPYAIGSYNIDANDQFSFTDMQYSSPYITNWSVIAQQGAQTQNSSPPSGVLSVLSSLTDWDYSWLTTFDNGVNTGDNFWMGYPNISCSSNLVNNFQQGNYNNTQAFWFVANGQTYLIVQ